MSVTVHCPQCDFERSYTNQSVANRVLKTHITLMHGAKKKEKKIRAVPIVSGAGIGNNAFVSDIGVRLMMELSVPNKSKEHEQLVSDLLLRLTREVSNGI